MIELKSGGLYDRSRKWKTNNKLLYELENGLLQEKYSLVNASMNQLKIEGYMSNYLRMIFGSFCLQKEIDWRLAMQIFEKYLIDISWTSNLWGWLDSFNLTAKQPRIFSIER